jgi:hypothetical protein
LKTIVLNKSRLQRMEPVAVSEPLDRCDGFAVMHCSEREARVDAAPIQQHRARAALAVIAALLGSCQREMLTQSVEKSCPGIEGQTMEQAVDLEFDAYWSDCRLGVCRLGGSRNLRETAEQERGCGSSGLQNRTSRNPKISVSIFIHGWRLRS